MTVMKVNNTIVTLPPPALQNSRASEKIMTVMKTWTYLSPGITVLELSFSLGWYDGILSIDFTVATVSSSCSK